MNQSAGAKHLLVEPDVVPAEAAPRPFEFAPAPARPRLFRQLVVLAMPVLAEQVLHMFVGLNDTWLANHVARLPAGAPAGALAAARGEMAAAGAARGARSDFLWVIGVGSRAVGNRATPVIARATRGRPPPPP